MASARGNRLYSGKAQMAYSRQRADDDYMQEQIDGYFDWASRRKGPHPKLRIVRHGFHPLAEDEPTVDLATAVAVQDEPSLPFPEPSELMRVKGAVMPESEPEISTVAEPEPRPVVEEVQPPAAEPEPEPGPEPVVAAAESTEPEATEAEPEPQEPVSTDRPIRMLRPFPMEQPGRRHHAFSYGKMAYGFLWGSAAALVALWIIDVARMM
jgi:hypothetical protein